MPRPSALITSDAVLYGIAAIVMAALFVLVLAALRAAAPEAPPAVETRAAAPAAPYRLSLADDGRSVHLDGLIEFGVTAALTALLETAGDVRVLHLESDGGRVAEARGLIRVIERFDLATSARGDCLSACTLALMGGRQRVLEPGARLGFHRYGQRSPMVDLFLDSAAEQDRDMAFFRRHGVAEAFLDRVSATPHESMWFPTVEELLEAGVVERPGPAR